MCKKHSWTESKAKLEKKKIGEESGGGGVDLKKKGKKKTKIKVKGYYEGGRKRQWMDDRRKVNLSD